MMDFYFSCGSDKIYPTRSRHGICIIKTPKPLVIRQTERRSRQPTRAAGADRRDHAQALSRPLHAL